MDWGHIFESILRVAIVGVILGAGLPALFAIGLRAALPVHNADGTTTAPNPVAKYVGYALFVVIAAIIVISILWIARASLDHHFGWKIFDFISGAYK